MTAPSDSYQYLYKEMQIDYIDNLLSITDTYYSDEYQDLNDLAIDRVFTIAKTYLNTYQYKIFRMLQDGYTQQEIADKHGLLQQSSVGKILHGNHNGMAGIFVKLRKFIITDIELRKIIREMIEILEDD